MCRMLAIVSRKPVPADVLLAFRQLSETGKTFRDFGCPQPNPKTGHPDGWGLAAVGPDGEFYERSGLNAASDPKYEDAAHRIAREISPPVLLLGHVRRSSTRDSIKDQYAHPFRREVDGRTAFFAHNGEIEGFGLRNGKIDSQEIFDHFLGALGPELQPIADFKQAIARAKAGLDSEFPRKVESYTFLMLDEDRVIAHRDARSCVPYYTLHETRTDDTQLICSEVLPNLPGRWRMLRNGEFVEMRL